MTVTCNRCGETWPRDPALEVACPQCRARIGVKCKRPSGHPCDLHHSRDALALARGLVRKCKGIASGDHQTRSDAPDDVRGARAATMPPDTAGDPLGASPGEIVPTVDGPREQLIVPGTARSAVQARQKRENSNGGRVRKGANLPADFGLFGPPPERQLFD